MNSLRRRLSVTLALVLLAAGALLAVEPAGLSRAGWSEDYALSRLHHDADLLYVRLHRRRCCRAGAAHRPGP